MKQGVFRWASAARTDQGNVRDHNEDACLDRGDAGFWVVADGMGGHEAGDFASRLIVERLGRVTSPDRPSEFVNRIEDELLGVNRHLYQKSQSGPEPTIIGSTVVTLVALDRYAVTVWAGDSRVYRLRRGDLTRVSRDHSEVEELVAQGLVQPEDAESHPQANVITRAVGGAEHLYLDYELREIDAGDRYLLCSDGLYKDVTEGEISDYLGNGDCDAACNSLIELALSRECADNVTVLVVDFEAVPAAVKQAPEKNAAASPKTLVASANEPSTDEQQAVEVVTPDEEDEEDEAVITRPRPVSVAPVKSVSNVEARSDVSPSSADDGETLEIPVADKPVPDASQPKANSTETDVDSDDAGDGSADEDNRG